MNLPFIDSHVHFWDPEKFCYDWLAQLPSIGGRHTPTELRQESAARFPRKIIFIECGAPAFAEVNWVEELAASEPRLAAIVARAPMDAGAATTTAIAELKKHPLVRGVRHNFQDEADPAFCLRPEFVRGVRELGQAGLSFDICCRHHQLAALIELVRQCPETRFILDHAGKPNVRAGELDPWRDHIAELATCPNLVCKLSGLITEAEWAQWPIEQLHPYALHLLATFGWSRLLFGSDWPVVNLAGGYSRWLDLAQQLVSALPPAQLQAIFHDNAQNVYDLGE